MPAALDALPTFIYVKDRDLRVVSANLSFCRALGTTREELVGKRTDPFLGDEGPLSARIDREVIETGTARLGVVEKYMAADGLHWLLTDKTPIKDGAGTTVGLVGTTVDITAQKQAEDALGRSEARLRFLTDNMADTLWMMDLHLRSTYVSPSIERLLGFTAEEWMAKRVEEMATPESVRRIRLELQRQLALEASGNADPNRTLTLESEFVSKSGATIWVEQVVRALRNEAGELVGLTGVSRDISARKRAEEALAQSEAQLRFLADHMADMLWTMDLGFHTTYVSPSVERVLGFTPDERKCQSLEEMVTPDSARRTMAALAEQLRLESSGSADPNRSLTMEVEYYHKDGSISWFENVMTAVRDPEGRLVGLLGVSRDISGRKQAEKELRLSERKFRELFEQSVDAINLVSVDGRLIEANPAWFRLFGYTPEDVVSYNARDAYVDPSGRARFLDAIAKQDHVEDEVQFKRKDGSIFDCHRTVTVRRASDGRVVGFQTVFHDITEQKRARQALKESEEKYRSLFELSKDAVYLVSLDGRFLEVNQAWVDLFGYTRDEAIRLRAEAIYEDPRLREGCFLPAIERQGEIVDWEVRFKKKNGTVMDCLCSVVARRDSSGAPVCLQGMVRDITAQKRAQQALKESEEKYRQLFDLSIAPISLIAPDGTLIEANDAWFRLFRYSREDMDSFRSWDLYQTRALRDESVRRLVDAGGLVDDEARMKTKDGTLIDVLRSMVVRRNPDGTALGYQTVWRDITEQKRARQALLESEEKYRRLFNQSVAPISLADDNGRIIEANDAWLQLFGYSRAELPGLTTYDLYEDPRDRDRTIQRAREAGQLVDDAARHRKKDGSLIEVLRSVSIMRDSTGKVAAYQTVYRDVTELKKAQDELLASREQLRELAARMQQVLERERTSVAHDLHDRITQGLTALKLDLDALMRRTQPGDAAVFQKLGQCIGMVEDLTSTSRDIMTGLRPGMLDDLGLCAAIDWQLNEFSRRTGIEFKATLLRDDSSIPPVHATALFRVLQELLGNIARHAGATTISVSLERQHDSIVLTVTDNGRGITDEEMASPDSLGLLGVRERVRPLGGDFAIRRGRGQGTIARVRIPATQVPPGRGD